ncbi:MAG: nucleoside triphosphate pyrophosphohydrolase [Deltaproteobacteria bacterium]|nr:nucleoside triphosphate pyrophosphohydrolase [Deltaproteobacteria bacterium]
MDTSKKDRIAKAFVEFVEIVERLRGENGCPWDKVQTHKSVEKNFIEEVYEVIDAIECEEFSELKEELGDVLLQVVFHAQMAKEENKFDIEDVIDAISQKIVYRHPHVFGNVKVTGVKDVLKNWEALKKKEKETKSVLEGVPKHLPALIKAYRVGEKVAQEKLDWDTLEDVFSKLDEEIKELKYAKAEDREEELGDVLFTVANIARKEDIDPHRALNKTIEKFADRVKKAEEMARKLHGKELEQLNRQTVEELYEKAKSI